MRTTGITTNAAIRFDMSRGPLRDACPAARACEPPVSGVRRRLFAICVVHLPKTLSPEVGEDDVAERDERRGAQHLPERHGDHDGPHGRVEELPDHERKRGQRAYARDDQPSTNAERIHPFSPVPGPWKNGCARPWQPSLAQPMRPARSSSSDARWSGTFSQSVSWVEWQSMQLLFI